MGSHLRRWVEIVTLILVLGLVNACASTTSNPDDAGSCGDLADLAVAVVVDARDSAANLEPKDLQGSVTGEAEDVMIALTESMASILSRSSELGCDSDTWNEEYQQRVLELPPLTLGGLFVLSIAVSSIAEPF